MSGTRALALVAVALMAVGLGGCGRDAETMPPVESAAPPADSGPISLWLSAREVPGDTDLVAVVVNRGTQDAMFGVKATIDRWDGSDWAPYRSLGMCLGGWRCTAKPQPLDGIRFYATIGLMSGPHQPGGLQRFSTADLDDGWYRVRQVADEEVTATGIFRVSSEATRPAPLGEVDSPGLGVSPVLLEPGGGRVVISPVIPEKDDDGTLEGLVAATANLADHATIERWSGSQWEKVGRVDLVPSSQQGGSPVLDRSAELPPLAPGAYRLVRADGKRPPFTGPFWVVENLFSTSAG